jgi:hypothetical protein
MREVVVAAVVRTLGLYTGKDRLDLFSYIDPRSLIAYMSMVSQQECCMMKNGYVPLTTSVASPEYPPRHVPRCSGR